MDKRDELDELRRLLAIDPGDLVAEFVAAPEILARAVEMYATAEAVHLRAELQFELVEAKLRIKHRELLLVAARKEFDEARDLETTKFKVASDAGEKYKKLEPRLNTPTVMDIDAYAKIDPEYAVARLRYIEHECNAKRLKGLTRAAEVKRDMLTSIGMRENAESRLRPLDAANSKSNRHSGTAVTPESPFPE